jgi:hypothetical protein
LILSNSFLISRSAHYLQTATPPLLSKNKSITKTTFESSPLAADAPLLSNQKRIAKTTSDSSPPHLHSPPHRHYFPKKVSPRSRLRSIAKISTSQPPPKYFPKKIAPHLDFAAAAQILSKKSSAAS